MPGHQAKTIAIGTGLFLFAAQSLLAASAPPSPEDVEFFESHVRPILVDSCYKCHSTESGKSKAGLRLDSRDNVLHGGESGAALVPGDPDKSLLIEAVRYTDEDLQMPPADDGGKLTAQQIAVLEEWVRRGAPDPRVGGKPNPMDMAAARQHWAFQPVTKPAVPTVKKADWIKTPVDAFVLAQLEAKKLEPSHAADPRTLLRRVTYDLTGLPPTSQEMDAFLKESTARGGAGLDAAYAKVVERLLASPRYGERWGRHWLDVARYADTVGYVGGNVGAGRRFPFSHTYRDYVIRAFNNDEPFDRLILEQLAADQLDLGEDKAPLAALGFITVGRHYFDEENLTIDDRIDVVTRGLMGLTVSCARCHDHKFDPIPTKDYYSLHGIFASSEEPKEGPLLKPIVETPAYHEFLRKTAAAEAKVTEREKQEVEIFLAELRAQTGDYLLGAHDAAALKPDDKFDVFAGTRKLNPDVLKRYVAWLPAKQENHDPVFAPWFALAALPEDEFAARAGGVIALLSHPSPGDAAANPVVVAALAKANKPPATLREVADVYNRVFADAEKTWRAQFVARKSIEALATPTLADPAQDEILQRLYATDAPANVGYQSAATMIDRLIFAKTAVLRSEVTALNWTEPGAPLRAMGLVDKAKPADSRIFVRGNPANPGAEAPRRFLEILSGKQRENFTHGSGRLELARAVIDAKNPLTARVFVNRVWGWHFGPALVRTPSDFGVRTVSPVQRELLDWLAVSFVENGWSVKQLQRAIVLSSTYRQASDERPEVAAIDPDNELIHRFNRRRLDVEAMRDTLLAVSGGLDLRAGGVPDDVDKEPFSRRRTVYAFLDRQELAGLFRTFDYPNPDTSTAQRLATTVPQQALFLMNSPFAQEQARLTVASPEVAKARSESARIKALYNHTLQRAPESDELRMAKAFLARPVPAAPRTTIVSGWQYGYGAFDAAINRVRTFTTLTQRKDGKALPADSTAGVAFGSLSLDANGGSPGLAVDQASVRRWVAPAAGVVQIDATLEHKETEGDGVRGRIVSNVRGSLGEWTVRQGKVETKLNDVVVEAGETIDFVVESGADAKGDAYTWAPVVAFTPPAEATDAIAKTWSAKEDFDNPPKTYPPLTRWEQLALVLLLSNELAFVD